MQKLPRRALAKGALAGGFSLALGGRFPALDFPQLASTSKTCSRQQMTHVSTSGGALEFLEGRLLPEVAALNDKTQKQGAANA